MKIKDGPFDSNFTATLVVRDLKDDNLWDIKRFYEAFSLPKLYHSVGVKFVIPLVAALQHIIDTGDRILSSLEKPVTGLRIRRGDRLNKKLNHSMSEETMVRKSSRFNYNLVLLHQQ